MQLEVGKKYVCRNAPDVKYVLIVYDALTDACQVLGVIHYVDGRRSGQYYMFNGLFYGSKVELAFDLVDEYKEPITQTWWLNVYPGTSAPSPWESRQLADDRADINRIACVKVVLTEGVWDE